MVSGPTFSEHATHEGDVSPDCVGDNSCFLLSLSTHYSTRVTLFSAFAHLRSGLSELTVGLCRETNVIRVLVRVEHCAFLPGSVRARNL